MKTYIGIDNGITGAIGWIADWGSNLVQVPSVMQQDYTKKKQNISRVDVNAFRETFEYILAGGESCLVLFERPMVNPGRFRATISAVRCLEAELCVIESLRIPYMYCDSKSWQKEFLPEGCKKEELKQASRDIGIRLFPELKEEIVIQKDADSLFIAEYARRKGL